MVYLAAITDIYKQQQRLGVNSYPHPRESCTQLLENMKFNEERVRREEFEDRGLGTLVDGYTSESQISDIVRFYFSEKTGTDLRNSVAFLLSHFCLLRGENARQAELPDLQTVMLDREGPSQCPALVLLLRQGKTNQFGRIEVSACLRNSNVEIYPFMALGCYFFWRWHIDAEPFPSFERSADWFNYKVLFTSVDPKKEMAYTTHLEPISKAFKKCNIISSKKTHAARGSSARMADLNGAAESDIRRQGHWNNTSMNGAYLTSLPRGVMRTMAGFPSTEGHFYLSRAQILPSESLQRKVFPSVDHWYDRLAAGACQQSAAARGFLELLKVLRITFLQDSVTMMEKLPHHPLWNNSLFLDTEYLSFKRYVYSQLKLVMYTIKRLTL